MRTLDQGSTSQTWPEVSGISWWVTHSCFANKKTAPTGAVLLLPGRLLGVQSDDLRFLLSTRRKRNVELFLPVPHANAAMGAQRVCVEVCEDPLTVEFGLDTQIFSVVAHQAIADFLLIVAFRDFDSRGCHAPADLAGSERDGFRSRLLDFRPADLHQVKDFAHELVVTGLELGEFFLLLLLEFGDLHFIGMVNAFLGKHVLRELEHELAHLPQAFRGALLLGLGVGHGRLLSFEMCYVTCSYFTRIEANC
jgi:hypothetical protein